MHARPALNRWRPLLFPVALIYGALVWWRSLFYRNGFFVSHRAPATVISIGNLTMGGTGKTPVTMYLAGLIQQMGYSVAILSRGYSRKTRGTQVVGDGQRVLLTPSEGGDEPVLMAKRLPDVPVVVDEDRYRGALFITGQFKSQVILLDDGFQHRALARDCDLVLLDATMPMQEYRMFPAGSLRERPAALKRADLVLWTRTNLTAPDSRLQRLLERAGISALQGRLELQKQLFQPSTGAQIPATDLQGANIIAFCGIANPRSFYHNLSELGLEPAQVRYFPDHHVYTAADLAGLANLHSGKEPVFITTEKDWVKLDEQFLTQQQVYVTRLEFHLSDEDRSRLKNSLVQCLPPVAAGGLGAAT